MLVVTQQLFCCKNPGYAPDNSLACNLCNVFKLNGVLVKATAISASTDLEYLTSMMQQII